jgi:hypothetical protein
MQPLAVVPHGHVIQDILLGAKSCWVIAPLYTLLLQATEETFCYRIIPTAPFFTHAADKTMCLDKATISIAGLLYGLV